MFRYLRLKRQPEQSTPVPATLSLDILVRDAAAPITIQQINGLPENLQKRFYRFLLPPGLLFRYDIDPFTWKGPGGDYLVHLEAPAESGSIQLSVRCSPVAPDAFIHIDLADNIYNGIDLNLLLLSDPDSPRFAIDRLNSGESTLFGSGRRNLEEEERALQAGLAPGQTQSSLGASRLVLDLIEGFLATLGHRSYFLEPLTYTSAWIFERRGFAYVRGHKLMDDIHKAFQPGGGLHSALDGSTPFRSPEAWKTVRGRSWAIHDGILETIGVTWGGLRMIKLVGKQAGVETFPGAVY